MTDLGRSRKSMRLIVALILATSFAFAGPPTVKVGNGDIAIAYDPKQPNEKISIVWLSYCVGRLNYFVKHRTDYPQKIEGAVIPKFKEEIHGRFIGLDTYKNMLGKKFSADPYWEDVKKVSEAGFLDEYVWIFFHRDSWPENEKPSKLESFIKWKKENIPDHKPMTYGALQGKKV